MKILSEAAIVKKEQIFMYIVEARKLIHIFFSCLPDVKLSMLTQLIILLHCLSEVTSWIV